MSAQFPSYDLLGVPISICNLESATEFVADNAVNRRGGFVCIRDVASLMATVEDADLMQLHQDAALVTPDGMPIAVVGRLRGHPVERTSGPDLMERVCTSTDLPPLRHYFLGGKPGVAALLAAKLQARNPQLNVVGHESPPFGPIGEEENRAIIERILASEADIVWVGISSPKQDRWMHRNFRSLPATLIGVGAAFDFHSGAVRRAPRWMRQWGLEWSFRLASEPRRLWRRYLVLAPRFVWRVLSEGEWRPRESDAVGP